MFDAIDTNGDGVLDEAEFASAQAAGVMPIDPLAASAPVPATKSRSKSRRKLPHQTSTAGPAPSAHPSRPIHRETEQAAEPASEDIQAEELISDWTMNPVPPSAAAEPPGRFARSAPVTQPAQAAQPAALSCRDRTSMLMEVFNMFDLDGSGALEPDELLQVFCNPVGSYPCLAASFSQDSFAVSLSQDERQGIKNYSHAGSLILSLAGSHCVSLSLRTLSLCVSLCACSLCLTACLQLGQMRRALGQKEGNWSEEQNQRLLEHIDTGNDGTISAREFCDHYEQTLSEDPDAFEQTVSLPLSPSCSTMHL